MKTGKNALKSFKSVVKSVVDRDRIIDLVVFDFISRKVDKYQTRHGEAYFSFENVVFADPLCRPLDQCEFCDALARRITSRTGFVR